MEETIKSILYQSLGVIAITKEKIEKAVDDIVAQGKLTKEEGIKFAAEIQSEARKTGDHFKQVGKDNFKDFIEKSGIPTRAEFDALNARLEALEKLNATRDNA